MKVALYGRHIKTSGFKGFYENFVSILKDNEVIYEVSSSYAKFLKEEYGIQASSCSDTSLTPEHFKCLISLGGDGTALDTLSMVKDSGLPVMGINLGRLGFLANIKMEEVEDAVIALKSGKTSIETRALIHIESDIDEINEFPYALNDFVVQKRDTSAMITVKANLNGHFLTNYWADGLIVATPTGSSGYSLSCGGPLLFPGSKSFIITPIAAHNLTVRPAVIPDDNLLEIETSGRADTILITLDARSFIVPSNTKLTIKKASFNFHTIKIDGTTYMDTIRNKLLWGADRRDAN
jgi:NAD+ kinase